MRRFGLHSDSRGADEIKGFPISIDFCNQNTELFLMFSTISPCFNKNNTESKMENPTDIFRETNLVLQLI